MNWRVEDLVLPLRVVITITAIVCVATFWIVLQRGRDPGAALFKKQFLVWALVMGFIGFLFTHSTFLPNGGPYLPFGVAPGLLLAVGSLFWKPARAAFDALSDAEVRNLSIYRAVFGAFLFAGAGLELFPPIFAIIAGTGDLLAGWLASIGPTTPDGRHRFWPLVVHGWGAIDLIDVAILGTLVVRPWIIETGSLGPSLLLPWMAVPVLFALNLHGLRRALKRTEVV